MRLVTQNMLVCNVKACQETADRIPGQGPLNFPLQVVPAEGGVQVVESEFNSEFIGHMIPKLEWNALRTTAAELSMTLPEEVPANASEDQDFLRGLHRVIIDTHVEEGELVCRNCGRSFPIKNGIPNMLLREDEV